MVSKAPSTAVKASFHSPVGIKSQTREVCIHIYFFIRKHLGYISYLRAACGTFLRKYAPVLSVENGAEKSVPSFQTVVNFKESSQPAGSAKSKAFYVKIFRKNCPLKQQQTTHQSLMWFLFFLPVAFICSLVKMFTLGALSWHHNAGPLGNEVQVFKRFPLSLHLLPPPQPPKWTKFSFKKGNAALIIIKTGR